MKVFISWSGSLSKNIAESLRQWLPGVIQAVRPYYSPDDITKGSRWSSEISRELDSSKIGIICLTQDNLNAPWIMFEAGALSKNLEKSKVCPILFNIEPANIAGPLIQFQAAKFSREEIKRVIKMINLELGEDGLTLDVLESVFEMWWPRLNDTIEKLIREASQDKKVDIRSEREILEEILNLTRVAAISRERLNGGNKINPEIIRDLIIGFQNISKEVSVVGDSALIKSVLKLDQPLRHIFSNLHVDDNLINIFENSLSALSLNGNSPMEEINKELQ